MGRTNHPGGMGSDDSASTWMRWMRIALLLIVGWVPVLLCGCGARQLALTPGRPEAPVDRRLTVQRLEVSGTGAGDVVFAPADAELAPAFAGHGANPAAPVILAPEQGYDAGLTGWKLANDSAPIVRAALARLFNEDPDADCLVRVRSEIEYHRDPNRRSAADAVLPRLEGRFNAALVAHLSLEDGETVRFKGQYGKVVFDESAALASMVSSDASVMNDLFHTALDGLVRKIAEDDELAAAVSRCEQGMSAAPESQEATRMKHSRDSKADSAPS